MQGRHDEAEPLYLETLETRRRVLGDDHPETLHSMNNLANLHLMEGRDQEAESLFLATLEARRRVLGPEHPRTAEVLITLAALEAGRGDRAAALDWLRQSVEAGWSDTNLMVNDADLALLHGDPAFDELVAEVRKRNGQR